MEYIITAWTKAISRLPHKSHYYHLNHSKLGLNNKRLSGLALSAFFSGLFTRSTRLHQSRELDIEVKGHIHL